MRRFVLVLLLVTVSCAQQPSKPQEKDQPSTALEAFMGKRGKLVVKDFYSLGRVASLGTITMDALVIYQPGDTNKLKGLRVEVTETGRFERSNISFIDLDELESLSQALAYMSDLAAKWAGQSHDAYTEVTYTSKGEFQVGFYQKGTQTGAFCKSGTIGAATAFPKIAELPQLKGFVDQAITLLKSK